MPGDKRLPGRWPRMAPPPRPPAAGPVPQSGDGPPAKLNGKLASETNVSVLGPSRVLHGPQPPHDVVVPGVAVTQQFVLLARNDVGDPKAIRLRLARNSTEGRIAVSRNQNPGGIVVAGVFTPVNVEWLDFVNGDHKYECVLDNGDQLWAIGTWAGMVPINVVVTVLEYTP